MFGLKKSSPINISSYYYSSKNTDRNHEIFEKSLDVYKPLSQDASLPIVVLVVGSGWMGHRWFVYRMTSWWNSGGPKTIASLNTVCVCVRHRGAFCRGSEEFNPTQPTVAAWVGLLSALVAVASGMWQLGIWVTLAFLSFWLFLYLGNQGSATLNEMVADVSEALDWIDNNKDKVVVTDSKKKQSTTPSMIFGGYSSGGHVSATLMGVPEIWKKHSHMFSGVIMISGVLSVKPEVVRLSSSLASNSEGKKTSPDSTSSADSNSSTATLQTEESLGYTSVSTDGDDSRQGQDDEDNEDGENCFIIQVGQNKPTWLTNLVMKSVWGKHSSLIPSPIVHPNPVSLPHLLLGNRKEMFGLEWLDVFFCSNDYHNKLRHHGVPSTFKLVDSDHWNILASRALRKALEEELATFFR